MTGLLNSIMESDFLLGMFGAASGAAILYSLKEMPKKIWDLFIEITSPQLHIRSIDGDFFNIVDEYFSKLSPVYQRHYNISEKKESENRNAKLKSKQVRLVAGVGVQFYIINGKLVKFSKKVMTEGVPISSSFDTSSNQGKTREEIIIQFYFSRKKSVDKLIKSIKEYHSEETGAEIVLYTNDEHGYIGTQYSLEKVSISSVILKTNQLENLLTDLDVFLASKDEYKRKGIPYRRTYLLYGPPGTGKSTIIRAVASYLDKDIANISLNNLVNEGALLKYMVYCETMDSVMCIEDIDDYSCTRRSDKSSDKDKRISFSGLLNIIDGSIATDNRIMFITTNKRENIDEALLRPGRIDYELLIDNCDYEQFSKLTLKYYEQLPELINSESWVDGIVSPATVQGVYLQNKNDKLTFEKEILTIIKTAEAGKD